MKFPDTIEQIAVELLIPAAMNAKLHSDGQVAQLAASMREFGFTNPVLVDADNNIIAGHGRVLAARKLGLELVPCIRLAHLTEAQRRAYMIADNRLSEIGGGWDWEILRAEMDHLAELADIDITLTGFDAADIPGSDLEPFGVEGDEQRGQGMNYLAFGDKKVPMSDDELAGMLALLEQHVAETGQPFGFASTILRRCSN
jgi:hypothetical protein